MLTLSGPGGQNFTRRYWIHAGDRIWELMLRHAPILHLVPWEDVFYSLLPSPDRNIPYLDLVEYLGVSVMWRRFCLSQLKMVHVECTCFALDLKRKGAPFWGIAAVPVPCCSLLGVYSWILTIRKVRVGCMKTHNSGPSVYW